MWTSRARLKQIISGWEPACGTEIRSPAVRSWERGADSATEEIRREVGQRQVGSVPAAAGREKVWSALIQSVLHWMINCLGYSQTVYCPTQAYELWNRPKPFSGQMAQRRLNLVFAWRGLVFCMLINVRKLPVIFVAGNLPVSMLLVGM